MKQQEGQTAVLRGAACCGTYRRLVVCVPAGLVSRVFVRRTPPLQTWGSLQFVLLLLLLVLCIVLFDAGKTSVWDYWFQHFTPQYQGLPSLGTLESIYNQQTVSVQGPQSP